VSTESLSTASTVRLDPEAADVHAEAARLRAQGPATAVELPGGVRAWYVSDPDLIRRLLSDPRISKDASRHWPDYITGAIPEGWPLRIWVDVRNALSAYGDEHKRLRRLIGAAFTTRRVRALTPVIESVTKELLDALDHEDPATPVDLRARFAWVLPLRVINTLLGVPETMHDGFRQAIEGAFATGLTEGEAAANGIALFELLAELVTRRRESPGDDVTSGLIEAYDNDSEGLSEKNLLDSLLLLIGAGHETTVNLIDHAIVNLLTQPAELAKVREGTASWQDVAEESLRHQAPLATMLIRFPVVDIEDTATGSRFGTGEPIVVGYAAAGRDPTTHGADADTFDISRPTRRDHLSFGHGAHYCLGTELARLEATISLRALFDHFPQLRLATPPDELRPIPSFISNGHQTLPALLGKGVTTRAG